MKITDATRLRLNTKTISVSFDLEIIFWLVVASLNDAGCCSQNDLAASNFVRA